ncbi:MAG: hypothetical protein K9L59_06435 [Desulfobacterales bacterium]|nr:hypothetical protein [Desulfobacterales bacterium]MCF8079139.1 hypothetical protein [Desulfobacterales bacterium]
MVIKRIVEWIALFATAGLMVFLKVLHLGVIHYNWFLIILLSWSLILVIVFRSLYGGNKIGGEKEENA